MPLRRVLILTFYYPPDLCAGSFRAGAFLDALRKWIPADVEVDVLTTMPNRYHSFRSETTEIENNGNVTVRRFQLKSHKSGFMDQALCFGSFAWQVLRYTRKKDYDLVFATSSRLMTAALGAYICRKNKAPLYLDIRDIFTDTMKDVLSGPIKAVVLPVFRLIERYTLRSATVINVVSKGFVKYFSAYQGENELRVFTNGIDSEFLDYDFRSVAEPGRPKEILVAGNIGEGQGLERLIPEVADLLPDDYELVVIGDGGKKSSLVSGCKGKRNVKILDPVNREELKRHYAQADVLLMHLNDYDAFKKVLPSKIFEYAATGKPILAGVSGYAAEFTTEYVENAAVFSPCDASEMVAKLRTLDLQSRNRVEFTERFARTRIMEDLVKDVSSFLPG